MSRSVMKRIVAARSLNTVGRAIITATVYYELFRRSGDPLVLAAIGLVQVIPVVLLFVPAGTLVDQRDRRMLATTAATITGVIGVGLALGSAVDAPIPVYLALLFVQGCMTSVHAPSASSLFPMLLPREQLERANRLMSTFSELAQIGGPLLAAVGMYLFDFHWVYAVVGITGIVSGILYRSLPAVAIPVASATTSTRKDWRVGLRFIFKSKLLLPALTLDMIAVLFAGVIAILPAIADSLLHTGEIGYGFLRAAQSVGAVSMAIIGGRIRPWQRPGRVLLIVVALFGIATMGIGFSRSLPLTIVLLIICGALDNISVVIRLTLEQLVVPDAIRGRVGAVHYVFIGMSNELGGAESGLAARLLGVAPAIIAGGAVATVVVGIVALAFPALARMPPLAALKPDDDPSESGP